MRLLALTTSVDFRRVVAGRGVAGGRHTGRCSHGRRQRSGVVVRRWWRVVRAVRVRGLLAAYGLRGGPRQAAGHHAGASRCEQERARVAPGPVARVVQHGVSVAALQPVSGPLDLLRHLADQVGAHARGLGVESAVAHGLELGGQRAQAARGAVLLCAGLAADLRTGLAQQIASLVGCLGSDLGALLLHRACHLGSLLRSLRGYVPRLLLRRLRGG